MHVRVRARVLLFVLLSEKSLYIYCLLYSILAPITTRVVRITHAHARYVVLYAILICMWIYINIYNNVINIHIDPKPPKRGKHAT